MTRYLGEYISLENLLNPGRLLDEVVSADVGKKGPSAIFGTTREISSPLNTKISLETNRKIEMPILIGKT